MGRRRIIADRFRIGKQIGSGGMGLVFLGHDLRQHDLPEQVELRLIPEERRFANHQDVEQRGHLLKPLRRMPEQMVILMDVRNPQLLHATAKPRFKERALVVRKAEAALLIYEVSE